MPPDAVIATLRHVWTTLQTLNEPMALVGGMAMTAWKRHRFTRDVDLLIAIEEARAGEVVKHLAAVGVRSTRPDPLVRIELTRFLQLSYEPPDSLVEVRIDLLLATTDFHQQALARRVKVPASELGFEVMVVSCEDLIVLKLVAGRIIDRVDVGELLAANRQSIDFNYLLSWIHQIRLELAFAEAWGDVFPGETAPN